MLVPTRPSLEEAIDGLMVVRPGLQPIELVVGKRVYVLDVFRARLQFNPLRAKVIELARLHSASVLLIEDASSGMALIQSLADDEPAGVPAPIRRRPEGDKIARVMIASGMIQSCACSSRSQRTGLAISRASCWASLRRVMMTR